VGIISKNEDDLGRLVVRIAHAEFCHVRINIICPHPYISTLPYIILICSSYCPCRLRDWVVYAGTGFPTVKSRLLNLSFNGFSLLLFFIHFGNSSSHLGNSLFFSFFFIPFSLPLPFSLMRVLFLWFFG
jgi:hypothetical protein